MHRTRVGWFPPLVTSSLGASRPFDSLRHHMLQVWNRFIMKLKRSSPDTPVPSPSPKRKPGPKTEPLRKLSTVSQNRTGPLHKFETIQDAMTLGHLWCLEVSCYVGLGGPQAQSKAIRHHPEQRAFHWMFKQLLLSRICLVACAWQFGRHCAYQQP